MSVDLIAGYWPSPWPGEDGGPARREAPHGLPGLSIQPGEQLEVTSRFAIASTMVVLREPGEVYLLCHSAGDGAVAWVEQIHPETLESIRRSPDLPGGRVWPGGLAVHANGSLYVVFGRHAHRLSPTLEVEATVGLPRDRPYNSFVILPDGMLATKDFAGLRPGQVTNDGLGASELLVLSPDDLSIRARLVLSEASIARISALDRDIYVVGDTSLLRVRWDGRALVEDDTFAAVYRTMPGQSYGWDAVLDAGAAWFLDNGAGSERYAGTFRGVGTNEAPLHLVRVGLDDGAVTLTEICGHPNGLIANPPAVDAERQIVVGYDSSNGIVAAFRFDADGATTPLWSRAMNHAAHPVRFADTGELVLCDHDGERGAEQVVVLDIATGAELVRADTGSPVQSVLFTTPGFDRDLYLCSFATISRAVVRPAHEEQHS